ncbi:MAG: MiaB/RimO family radical SAM methylthiotransferase, partial [Terriglobales bacterium]
MSGASFRVQNFGCRANQADGAAIARGLEEAGWRQAEAAGLVVFNTCTVTAAADAEARRAIRRLHREQPEARIWVTGCYAQRAPEELRRLEGVERVLGHAEKAGLAALAGRPAEPASEAPAQGAARTRPLVRVQDGCGNACSFCVIPAVRGGLRSRPSGEVAAEVRAWAEAGVEEVVLTGIHLGQWGRDLPGRRGLPDLLRALLAQTALPRIRLSSVEPMNWTAELIGLLAAEPRLAPHAHIPLQSGSGAVLRRMRRRYRPEDYATRVHAIRRLLPDAAIGADVMAGFPGET